MKKFFYTKMMVLLIVMLSVAMNVRAQLTADAPWVFESGVTYDVAEENFQFKNIYATFTAPSDGVLTMTYVGVDELSLYTDATYTEFAEVQPVWQGSYSPRVYEMDVKAGETYYFHRSFIMNYGTINVKLGATSAPLEIKNIYPKEGDLLYASSGQLSVEFSKPVSYGAATLSVGTVEESLIGNGMMGIITYDVKSVLMSWYNLGYIAAGDEVTLTINDVCNNSDETDIFGTDGRVVKTFKVGAKPIQLIRGENLPTGFETPMVDFLSYYVNPTKVVLEFDGAISLEENKKPIATISFGDMESGYYYTETLEIDIAELSSGIISLDISNKLRRMVDMIPNYTDLGEDMRPTTIVLSIDNVRGTDGNYAYSTGSGALGSYSYEYTYKELKNDIVSDFTPAIGANFDDVKSIELYIRGEKELQYEGVAFMYISSGEEQTEIVPLSSITREPDFFDTEAMVLTIPVPEITPDAGTEVTVTLANLRSTDGLDYSSELTAKYKVTASGIEQVMSGGDDKVTVYSMSGVRLMKNVDKTSLGRLRKGIYIINGEKTLLR